MKNINEMIKKEILRTKLEIESKIGNEDIEVFIDFRYEVKGNAVDDLATITICDDDKHITFECISPKFIFLDSMIEIFKKLMDCDTKESIISTFKVLNEKHNEILDLKNVHFY